MLVHLREHEELALELVKERYQKRIMQDYPCQYRLEHVLDAFEQYINGDLTYNTIKGNTAFKRSSIGWYTDGQPPVYLDIAELIEYEFIGTIMSSANRLAMGYKTV